MNDGIQITLGQKIRLLRESHNYTQKDLADKLNISDKTLSSYECNRRPPDTDTCKNIASIFNVSLDFLLRDDTCIGVIIPLEAPKKPENRSYDTRISKLDADKKRIIDTILDMLERHNVEKAAAGE